MALSFWSLFKRISSGSSRDEFIQRRAPIKGITSGNNFAFKLKVQGEHVYMECNPSGRQDLPVLIFCHGLFGSFRNFAEIGFNLSYHYRIIVPCLPMYDAPLPECSVQHLGKYLESFMTDLDIQKPVLVGNSMGGGAILEYTIRNPENVAKLILIASSGLSFIPMKGGFLKIREFQYVKELLSGIFYDLSQVNDEEVREVHKAMQNKQILLRCLSFTRSTKSNFLHEPLRKLAIPTLILWGRNDTVTPPHFAEEFKSVLRNSTLFYLENCGHVPCYEKPKECLKYIDNFLSKPQTLHHESSHSMSKTDLTF